jgi:hypothetical protein
MRLTISVVTPIAAAIVVGALLVLFMGASILPTLVVMLIVAVFAGAIALIAEGAYETTRKGNDAPLYVDIRPNVSDRHR